MTDICITCKENSALIVRSANLTTDRLTEVSIACVYKYVLLMYKNFIVVQATQKAINHKTHEDKERNYYRSVLKTALGALKSLFTDESEKFSPPLTRPIAVLNIVANYSFDYAQQVCYMYMYNHTLFSHRFTIHIVHCSQAQFIS